MGSVSGGWGARTDRLDMADRFLQEALCGQLARQVDNSFSSRFTVCGFATVRVDAPIFPQMNVDVHVSCQEQVQPQDKSSYRKNVRFASRRGAHFTSLWQGELNPSVVLGLMIGNVVNPGCLARLRRIPAFVFSCTLLFPCRSSTCTLLLLCSSHAVC